jgi:hypothetical protein
VIKKIPPNNRNVYLHVGMRLRKGKKMGVPAQTMVSMLMEMDLNLMADI